MAGDIALQEILGPLPDVTMRQLVKVATDAGTNAFIMKMTRDVYRLSPAESIKPKWNGWETSGQRSVIYYHRHNWEVLSSCPSLTCGSKT
jgi:hypothetical protein